MAKQPDTKGFDSDQIDYLVSHAQQFHGPSDFSKEVSMHLNKALGLTPEDQFGQVAQNQAEAIQNTSEGGNPPIIPGSTPKLSGQTKPDFSTL
jgi:hypothetical protein